MSLSSRVRDSKLLTQQEKLILGILSGTLGNPTAKELVDCLQNEPYELNQGEILDALDKLNSRGLIMLSHFTGNRNGVGIDTHITFVEDWVFKID